ncbi:MAG: hypothetical protein PHH60_03350 [Candidatus Margulisbacteria bacterium]|nr:hypothetical protein [Candidatus Margulisiibacteriota bacterium]
MSILSVAWNYVFGSDNNSEPAATLSGCACKQTRTDGGVAASASFSAAPSASPPASPPTPPAPPTPSLRTECLSVSQVSTAQLSQLGCLTGGVQTARQRTDEARSGFLQLFGQTLPNGTIIIRRPQADAPSEGIGFGGVIYGVSGSIAAGGLILSSSSSQENQQAFWSLFNARREYFLQPNGVMAWLVSASGQVVSTDSASDGDQDWIGAELEVLNRIQCGQWQLPAGMTLDSFRSQIQGDLDAFWTNHIRERGGRLLFLPTNGAWAQRGDGRDVYYPSYSDPHFLRLFAAFDQGHDWARLVSDVQALNQVVLSAHDRLGAAGQNPMPAKVFVRASGGNFSVDNYYQISRHEGVSAADCTDNESDSIRFFLRQARAAILDGDQTAREMLSQILTIASITDPASAHLLAGSQGAPSPLGWNNTLARASYGIAVLGSGDSTRAQTFFCTVLDNHRGQYFGEWDGAREYYYDQSLILQMLDLAFPE